MNKRRKKHTHIERTTFNQNQPLGGFLPLMTGPEQNHKQ